MSVRTLVSSHKKLALGLALLLVGLAVFVVVYFEPQAIFLEKTVKEAAPIRPASAPPSGTSSPQTGAAVVASGNFRSLEHRTTGRASLIRLADGSHILRFENLDTSNGPDLLVYLSELPSTLGWRDYGERFLELGELKGNRGDQNYRLPKGTDITRFRSAVIWCGRFEVGFGVAPLNPVAT